MISSLVGWLYARQPSTGGRIVNMWPVKPLETVMVTKGFTDKIELARLCMHVP
jgi:hypothetical protein